jgi:hypothetical protein
VYNANNKTKGANHMKKTLEQKIQEVEKKLIAPMQKIDRANLDQDLIRDIALQAINTEQTLKPYLKAIQKKYKQGKYDRTLALLATFHMTTTALDIYAKFYPNPAAWKNTINKFHRIAIAEEILEEIENNNWHKELWT